MVSAAFFLLPFVAFAIAAPTDGAAAPTIKSFGLNGSGCAPGSTTTSTDGRSINATFSSFSPQVTDANPTLARQNCQATISVSVPNGQQFSLSGVQYNGFAQLEKQVVVTHSAYYYFQGSVSQNTASATLSGPVTKDVDLSNSFSASPIWSACGGSSVINLNIAVAVDNTNNKADGVVFVDNAKIGPFITRSC